ncbi:hypothetical protein A2U01_0085367, partial [Trifolium medium]|nr:hypothetical protein [Trifolium medium]
MSSLAKMTMTTISIMLPLQYVSLFDPGGTHLVTSPPSPKRRNRVVVPTSLLAAPILKLNLNLRNRPPE